MRLARFVLRSLALVAAIALCAPALAASIPSGFDPTSFDRSCKACDDFFTFANGNFLKNNPIPAADATWGVDDLLAEDTRAKLRVIAERAAANTSADPTSNTAKIGAYYADCMDTTTIDAAGITPLRPQLDEITSIHDVASLLTTAGVLHGLGVDLGFSLDATSDAKDSSKTIADLGPSELGMPDRDYYVQSDAPTTAIRTRYGAYVRDVLRAAGMAEADAVSMSAAIIKLETGFAQATPDRADLRDPLATYHPMSLNALQHLTPSVDWHAYFEATGAPNFTSLNVELPTFTTSVVRAMNTTPIAVWRAYATFRLLNAYATSLPNALNDAHFAFYSTTLQGVKQQHSRSERCVRAVSGALGEALGAEYVAAYFPATAKARAQALVDNLQNVLHDEIGTLAWMSPQTKTKAQAKLAALTKKVGYPDHFRDYSALMIARGSYAQAEMASRRFAAARKLAKIDRPTDRTEWDMSPQTINAYYADENNEIVFPAAILQRPYFDPGADDAVNYGSIGAVIGHEMTHGFDDQGRKFDAAGNLDDWWTPQDAKRFNAQAQCIVDQFSGYTVAPGVHENGKLEQGEAIADLGGLTIAWKAFQRTPEYKAHKKIGGYTPEQRFFIAYAQSWAGTWRTSFAVEMAKTDPHPENRFRVNGTLANMPEFRAAFACPEQAKMVRKNACRVW